MRGANGIDVQPLHGLDVLLYLRIGDGTSVLWREVVAVDTVEHHPLTVDDEGTVAADAHLTEAHLRTTHVDGLAIAVFQRQHEVVEVRRLSTPEFRCCHVHVEGNGSLPKPLRGRGCLITCSNGC